MDIRDELLLDVWMRHIAETMRLSASAMPPHRAPHARTLKGWALEIEIAAKEVEIHNRAVLARCTGSTLCHDGRSRRCPQCPAEFVLRWPGARESGAIA